MPKFLNTIRLPKRATAPSSPVSGDMYYNTSDQTAFVYDGSSWLDLVAGGGGGGGGGDITAVIAGVDLTGGATSGAATLNIAPSVKAVSWWMGS